MKGTLYAGILAMCVSAYFATGCDNSQSNFRDRKDQSSFEYSGNKVNVRIGGGEGVYVDAPGTRVRVNEGVSVDAPGTRVRVNEGVYVDAPGTRVRLRNRIKGVETKVK